MHLGWDYITRTVIYNIPNYFKRALIHFLHIISKHSKHLSHLFVPPKYDTKQQDKDPISTARINPKEKK